MDGMIGQFTPGLRCLIAVAPFRFVAVINRNEAFGTPNNTTEAVGVTQGSTRRFDDTNHADVGDPVRLQPGEVVQIECGTTIAAGDILTSDSTGRAIVHSGAAAIAHGTAIEAGGLGDIIRMSFTPELTPVGV